MSAAEIKKAAAVTCLACGGEYRRYEERAKGIYSSQYCRWCDHGKMNMLQVARWNEKDSDPYTRKSSGIIAKVKQQEEPTPNTTEESTATSDAVQGLQHPRPARPSGERKLSSPTFQPIARLRRKP